MHRRSRDTGWIAASNISIHEHPVTVLSPSQWPRSLSGRRGHELTHSMANPSAPLTATTSEYQMVGTVVGVMANRVIPKQRTALLPYRRYRTRVVAQLVIPRISRRFLSSKPDESSSAKEPWCAVCPHVQDMRSSAPSPRIFMKATIAIHEYRARYSNGAPAVASALLRIKRLFIPQS